MTNFLEDVIRASGSASPEFKTEECDDCKRALRQYDHMGVGCIDIALWDLAGKQLNAPIRKMLGGWRTRLPTYASSYHGDRNGGLSSAQAYVDFAEQCYAMGYRAFKMHGWCDGNVKEESEAVLALGRAFRGRMNLMLDPACELRTFADALAVGRACDEAGFFWYEDPMRDGGWSQHLHRKLRHFVKTPLLQTEHVCGVEPKADFIVNDATDFSCSSGLFRVGIGYMPRRALFSHCNTVCMCAISQRRGATAM